MSYAFYGALDYTVVLLRSEICICIKRYLFFAGCDALVSLGRDSMFLGRHQILNSIVEVKSLREIQTAAPRITAEVVIFLILTWVCSPRVYLPKMLS